MRDGSSHRPLSAAALAVVSLLPLSACGRSAQMEPAVSPVSPPSVAAMASSPGVAVAAEPSSSQSTSDYGYAFADDPIAAGSFAREERAPPSRAKGAPVTARKSASPPPPPPSPPPSPPPPGAPTTTAPASPAQAIAHRESLLIYTATLTLAVFQVEASLDRIEELARSIGGYLASRTDASIVVRVPRGRFQEALAEIEKVGDVLHRQVDAQDVSDQVVDLEARLKNARAVRDRLAQLLQGATATKDALAIEKELARVMGEIEQMEGKLQLLSDKVAYSTVTVAFQPLRTNDVHTTARLPFPWLEGLGLGPLLRVK